MFNCINSCLFSVQTFLFVFCTNEYKVWLPELAGVWGLAGLYLTAFYNNTGKFHNNLLETYSVNMSVIFEVWFDTLYHGNFCHSWCFTAHSLIYNNKMMNHAHCADFWKSWRNGVHYCEQSDLYRLHGKSERITRTHSWYFTVVQISMGFNIS